MSEIFTLVGLTQTTMLMALFCPIGSRSEKSIGRKNKTRIGSGWSGLHNIWDEILFEIGLRKRFYFCIPLLLPKIDLRFVGELQCVTINLLHMWRY